jgi:TonB-linked SusC/RagA family outer membrane protein
MDGKFTLQVADNADVQISYIGYLEQIVNTSGKSNIIVTLVEDTKVLDEVLVVGYGTARKSDITGAVVRADLAALQESPNISLLGALQGLVPGLNVGATTSAGSDPSFSIRGRTSISGTTSPLIVLDGIIYRGNIVDINVNDVESIDILKDASATAIYGSQASNGVILITTKTGKTKSKPIISYNGYASYQQPTNKKLVPENREGFLRKIADRFLEESRIGDDMLQMNPDWDPSKHLMDRNALEGYNNGVDTDWWDLLTNDTPYIQSHNMSIRGKSDLNGYFFSVGYLDQENLIINDKYQRYNIRINLDMDVTNWLTVGTQSAFTMSDYSGTTPTLSNVIGLPPIVAVRDSEGQLIKQPYKSVNNPLLEIQEKDLNKRYFMNATFYADIKFPFIEGLNYRINFSQYMRNTKDFNFSDLKQNFQGEGYKANNSEDGWTFDNIVSYKKKFGIHDMDVTLLYGAEKREYESTTARSRIFTNNTLGYNKLSAGQADLQSAESGAWEEASLYSMARLRYTFNDKYTFTGTVRRDGFSGFGENHKFGVFPSAAVAWRINEEEFMKAFEWMDNLKLRLSYGKNGNRTIDRYQTLAKLNSGNGYVYGDGSNAEQRQWLSALANADLKWEVANTFNIGIDFGIMRNRIFGYLDYYTSNTYDLLYNINIPQINGLSSIPSNIGKMGNKGFELSLTAIPIKNRDFSWDITFNYSINRNKVKSILGIDADGDGKEDDLISNKIFIGEPYGVAYDYNIIGMWQLADYHAGIIPSGFTYGTYKIEDIDGDGNYTADKDRKILGYIDPSYRFGIQNTLRYKNWELKMFINSIQGGKNYYYGQPGSALPNPDNIYQNNLFNFDYWTPENPNARYRQLGYYTQTLGYGFSPYVQRSFIRLQDISLSYTVPQSFLEKLNISRLNLFITGKNLITITDWDGWDPETGNGLNTDSLPLMKSYTFGLNFEF